MTDTLFTLLSYLRFVPGEPMLFSSGLFWVLFLLFLPIYASLHNNRFRKTLFVFLFSLFFYYKSSGLFVLLLIATSVLDWNISRLLVAGYSRRVRKCLATIPILTSLGILAYFKYSNFFLWNITTLVGSNFQPLELVLPVGISFYTFQSVSYIIDVYRYRVRPARRWLDYAFFLSFFPALVAGPIVRADYFLPQIRKMHIATHREIWLGLWLAMLGVVKKAVIADYIAQYNDLIFNNPGSYSGFETLMGIIGYSMQIYCDFSGYSDMAIGLAMIMGFRLALNFRFPYKSVNVAEFWHRWHISLSTWLRDYVYIPLGGNRKGTARTYMNNFITMLVGGLWHGAAWRFVLWGGLHGTALAVHKASRPWLRRLDGNRVFELGCGLLTFAFVAALWVLFRADSVESASAILLRVVSDFNPAYVLPFAAARSLWIGMMVLIIVAHLLPERFWQRMALRFVESPWIMKLAVFMVLVQVVVEFRSEEVVPFIYFSF